VTDNQACWQAEGGWKMVDKSTTRLKLRVYSYFPYRIYRNLSRR
jgi:hypothetical protein